MDLVPNEWTQQAAEGMLDRHIPSSRIPSTPMEKPPLLEKSPLRCPRCDSSNTKFCYYNNYSLSQPRHFCKSCKRYWTRGGTLRNVPVGGGCRKNKRIRKASPVTSAPPPNPLSFLPTSSSISPSAELGFLFGNFPSSEMGFPGLQSPYGFSIVDGYLPGLSQIPPCPPLQGFGLHQISSTQEMMENKGILEFSGVQQLDVKPTLGISNGRSDWEITSCETADFPLHWSSGALTDSSNSGFPIIPLL